MIAVPWYFARSGDMTTFGWVYILTNIAALFWVPYGGTLIDRFDRKQVFLYLNATMTMVVGGIALIGFNNGDLPWPMVGLIFMLTFFNYNIHFPNLYAFVQEISEPQHYGRITSYLEIQGQTSAILSGAFAAILLEGTKNGAINIFGFYIDLGMDIKAWTIYEIFAIDAATYVVAFLIIYRITFESLKKRKKEVGSVISRLRTGWDFLKGHMIIFLFGITSFAIFISVLTENFYLIPLYVSNQLNEAGDVYAASRMYYGIGAIFAGLTVRYLIGKYPVPTLIAIATFIIAGRFFLLSLTADLVLFYAMAFLLGIFNAGSRILRVTYLFNHIPNEVFGRTGSIFFLGNIVIRTLFVVLFNMTFFQMENRIIYAYVTMGVFLVLAGLLLFVYRKKLLHVPLVDGHRFS
jgi:hypothetical protein